MNQFGYTKLLELASTHTMLSSIDKLFLLLLLSQSLEVAPHQSKKDVECYNCHEYGHYARECKVKAGKAKFAEEKKEADGTVLLAHNESRAQGDTFWYLDSGASNHMCGYRHMFEKMDESVTGSIAFGDLSKSPVQGKGDIRIRLKNGGHQYISNVYYVPGLKTNILSLGQLLEKGYDIHLKHRILSITSAKGVSIARVEMTNNRMFVLRIEYLVARREGSSQDKGKSIEGATVEAPGETSRPIDAQASPSISAPSTSSNDSVDLRDNLTMFCLRANTEPSGFEEASRSPRGKIAMDERSRRSRLDKRIRGDKVRGSSARVSRSRGHLDRGARGAGGAQRGSMSSRELKESSGRSRGARRSRPGARGVSRAERSRSGDPGSRAQGIKIKGAC